MVIQVVDSQPIETTTGEFESKSEDQVDSTNEQEQPAPMKMTSVIASLSKATNKSQNVGGDCLDKQVTNIKTENLKNQADCLAIEMENLKIKTEEVSDDKEKDECSDLLEQMNKLKVNDRKDSPNVTTRKMVSVLKTRAKQKAKESDEDDDDDEFEDEKDRKCKNEILVERGLTKTERPQKYNRNSRHPYAASPMSESSYISQDSPPYQPQCSSIYNSDNSNSSSGSRYSPPLQHNPLQQQIIKCVSPDSGNGGTCQVYNVEGQVMGSSEAKASTPPKCLHLGSGGIVSEGSPILTLTTITDNNSSPNINQWLEQNVSPSIYFYQSTNFNYEQDHFNTPSVSDRSRENSIGESSPMSTSYCLSPASSQEPFSPASSGSGSAMSPTTINNLYNLDLESDGSNLIAEINDFGKSSSSSLDSDAADELIASIQPDYFPGKDLDCYNVDFDYADKFEDIKSLDENLNMNNNLLSIELENFIEQNQPISIREHSRQISTGSSQSRSRSNSGKSDVERRQLEIINKYPKILPKVSDSTANETPTSKNVPVTENKSARDRLQAKLDNKKKTRALLKVDMNSLNFYQVGDVDGDTNLHIVFGKTYSDEDRFAVVEKFACCKASLDIPNLIGQTPLFCAVERNDPLIVEYLLERGADPGYSCIDGTTPMHCVAKHGDAYVKVARILCSKCKPQQLNKKNKDGLTPLHYAVKFCQTKCVGVIEALLANGAGLAGLEAQASKDGKSALHMAVEKPSLEMVSAICNSCINIFTVIDHYTFSRDTALHLAARLNSTCNEDLQISIIRVLIKHGAKSVKNKEGKFPKQLVPDKRPKVKKFLTSFKCNLIENM